MREALLAQPWWLFLALACFSLALTSNARRPGGRPVWLAWVLFFTSWFTTELAVHHLIFQGGLALYLVNEGALLRWPGWLALGICALSWWALFRLHITGHRTWDLAVDALDRHLPSEGPARSVAPLSLFTLLRPFSMKARGVVRHRDLSFHVGADHALRADVFHRRDLPRGAPLLLFLHGGGWSIGFRRFQGLPLLNRLAEKGWVCVSADYRLSPDATYPDHLLDVKRAIAWTKENAEKYGGDPEFVILAGSSAGGHLASMAALSWDDAETSPFATDRDLSVAACVSFYGHYDFLDRSGIEAPGLKDRLENLVFKRSIDEEPEIFERASPLAWVRPDAPPFLLIHGERDSLVPPAEGRDFAEALRAASDNAVIHLEVPGAQHAFEMFRSVRSHHAIEAVSEFASRLKSCASTLALFLLCLSASAGCDKSGIHPIGRVSDIVAQCSGETSTWLSSTSDGVEVMLIGTEDPAGSPSADGSRCFAFGFIHHDTSVRLDYGTYTLDAAGDGSAYFAARYQFDYQPEVGTLERDGAFRRDYQPIALSELTIEADGAQLLVGLQGRARRMTNLYDVISRLDPVTLEGAIDLNRLLNVPVLMSQARIVGFGSGGMTQYVGSPGTYSGLIDGSLTVSVASFLMPDTTIAFDAFEDVSGIVIGGRQFTNVDLSAAGTVTDTMTMIFRGSSDPADVTFSGHLELDLIIDDGLPISGENTLVIDGGGTFMVDQADGLLMDLRRVLPEQAP